MICATSTIYMRGEAGAPAKRVVAPPVEGALSPRDCSDGEGIQETIRIRRITREA